MSRFYYDQRGHGRSDYGTPEFWNLRTWADDLRRLYDTLGLVKPVLASTTGGRSDYQRSAEVSRRLGGDEAAAIAERDFADPTEESLADFRRVCHPPLYISKPGDAETLRQRRARSIQTTEVNRHYFRNETSRFDPWSVADMIKWPVLILAGEAFIRRVKNGEPAHLLPGDGPAGLAIS